MEINNNNIINNLIDKFCIIDNNLYYNIDHQLIHNISYTLIKLNIYYSDQYIYNSIINRLITKSNYIWKNHRNIINKRKKIYQLIDYIIKQKNINNFDIYLKYKITDYYLYKI